MFVGAGPCACPRGSPGRGASCLKRFISPSPQPSPVKGEGEDMHRRGAEDAENEENVELETQTRFAPAVRLLFRRRVPTMFPSPPEGEG